MKLRIQLIGINTVMTLDSNVGCYQAIHKTEVERGKELSRIEEGINACLELLLDDS